MLRKKILPSVLSALLLTTGVSTVLMAKPQQKQKPFLIQGKLPHLTKKVKMMWDDPKLALTKDQKKELVQVRKSTMMQVRSLAKKIFPLENEIVKATKKGEKPQALQNKVEKLAKLKAKATMVHLHCLYNTKKILTPQQLKVLKH